MLNEIDDLPDRDHLVIAFDGTDSKRAEKMAAKRSSGLNDGIRKSYSQNASQRSVGKKVVANWMGRPMPWFQEELAQRMEGRGITVISHPEKQADELICRAAIGRAGCWAYSLDRDFLVFSRNIDGIIFIDRCFGMVSICKDRLAEIHSSSDVIFWSYWFGGCDDAPVKIPGVGFKRALQAISGMGRVTNAKLKQRFSHLELVGKLWERGNSIRVSYNTRMACPRTPCDFMEV